jgi:HEAT repeat protein
MPVDSLAAAVRSLQGDSPRTVEEGIDFLRPRLAGLDGADLRSAVEGLCSLFYVDTGDRPDLQPLLDRAVEILAAQGTRVVSQLLELMRGSDIKCHLYLARTLGAIGPPALPALRRAIATEDDPYSRSFALFAVGKVHAPEVRETLSEVIGSLLHPDKEVRDSAARTLGKIAEVLPAGLLTAERRAELFDALFRALSDLQPPVRAKAVRSLGKMARAGYLTPEQDQRLRAAVLKLLGEDESHEWDRAYIVRREAEEALRHLGQGKG